MSILLPRHVLPPIFRPKRAMLTPKSFRVIFEVVRRRYGNDAEAVRIEKDGYDILLT